MGFDKLQVVDAVELLKKLAAERSKSALIQEEDVLLTFELHKLPKIRRNPTTIRMRLPHSTLRGDACLIVGDGSDRNRESIQQNIDKYEALLRKAQITNVKEVIPLLKLKLEYKPYEARRALASQFDIVLADERVMRFLPTVLGKSFYSNKKKPIQVKMGKEAKIGVEIKKALATTQFEVTGKGSCSSVTVALLDMPDDDIIANVMMSLDVISARIPGGLQNLRSAGIKVAGCPLLPVFRSSVERWMVPVPEPVQHMKQVEELVMEEVSTIRGKVSVSRDGTITILKPDGSLEQIVGGGLNKFMLNRQMSLAEEVKSASGKEEVESDSDGGATDGDENTEPAMKQQKTASNAPEISLVSADVPGGNESTTPTAPSKESKAMRKRRSNSAKKNRSTPSSSAPKPTSDDSTSTKENITPKKSAKKAKQQVTPDQKKVQVTTKKGLSGHPSGQDMTASVRRSKRLSVAQRM